MTLNGLIQIYVSMQRYIRMNEFEFELGFEELPSDDEYLDMKAAYKLGKKDFIAATVVQKETGVLWTPFSPYHFDDIRHTHYMNGWQYQLWVSINESSIRSGDQWPTT